MSFFDKFKKNKETSKKVEKEEKKEVKAKKQEYSTLKPKEESVSAVSPNAKEVKTTKSNKVDTKNAYKILIKPLVTEKATALAVMNKYCFEVAKDANKIEVSKAIENLYGVKPLNINFINSKGKNVTYGRTSGKKRNWKKAMITLKSGEKIEIYEGV